MNVVPPIETIAGTIGRRENVDYENVSKYGRDMDSNGVPYTAGPEEDGGLISSQEK